MSMLEIVKYLYPLVIRIYGNEHEPQSFRHFTFAHENRVAYFPIETEYVCDNSVSAGVDEKLDGNFPIFWTIEDIEDNQSANTLFPIKMLVQATQAQWH